MQAVFQLNSFVHRVPRFRVIRLQLTHHRLTRLLGLQVLRRRFMLQAETWLLKLHRHLNWMVQAGGSRNLVATKLDRFQDSATTEYSDGQYTESNKKFACPVNILRGEIVLVSRTPSALAPTLVYSRYQERDGGACGACWLESLHAPRRHYSH